MYRLAIKGEAGGHNRPIVTEEYVARDNTVLLHRPDADDQQDRERLTQTHLEQIAANQPFRDIANHFARVQYFHLVPQVIRDPSQRAVLGEHDVYGTNFIASINATPRRTRDAWLGRMQAALRSAVPEFETLGLEVDAAGKPHLRAGYRNWRQAPAVQTEAEFSDGTLRLIGLLWTLISAPAGGGVLLLEEPELSLNAAIVRTLPTVLATAQRSRELQVILSTHAPEIVDDEGVDADEVLVLRVTNDGTVGQILSAIPEFAHELEAGLPKYEIVDELISPGDLAELVRAAAPRR
jgi:predicted ATPase